MRDFEDDPLAELLEKSSEQVELDLSQLYGQQMDLVQQALSARQTFIGPIGDPFGGEDNATNGLLYAFSKLRAGVVVPVIVAVVALFLILPKSSNELLRVASIDVNHLAEDELGNEFEEGSTSFILSFSEEESSVVEEEFDWLVEDESIDLSELSVPLDLSFDDIETEA